MVIFFKNQIVQIHLFGPSQSTNVRSIRISIYVLYAANDDDVMTVEKRANDIFIEIYNIIHSKHLREVHTILKTLRFSHRILCVCVSSSFFLLD